MFATRVFQLALCVALAGAVGCGGIAVIDESDTTDPTGPSYPGGPYGVAVGDTLKDLTLIGYTRPGLGIGPSKITEIALSDFYNPGGNQSYGADGPFEDGVPKPVALVIQVTSVWVTSSISTPDLLNEPYATLQSAGGELLQVLAEGFQPGEVATVDNLDNWVDAFDGKHPTAIDPNHSLGDLLSTNSFPGYLLVDTRDMHVVEAINGVPQEGFWNTALQLAKN